MRWGCPRTLGGDRTFIVEQVKGHCDVQRREDVCVVDGAFLAVVIITTSLMEEWEAREVRNKIRLRFWKDYLSPSLTLEILEILDTMTMATDDSNPAQCLGILLFALTQYTIASFPAPSKFFQMFSRCEVLVRLHVSELAWKIPSVYFVYIIWHVFATLLLLLRLPTQTCFCSVGPISAPGADTHPSIKPTKLNTALLPLYQTPSFGGTPFKIPAYAHFPPFPPSSLVILPFHQVIARAPWLQC